MSTRCFFLTEQFPEMKLNDSANTNLWLFMECTIQLTIKIPFFYANWTMNSFLKSINPFHTPAWIPVSYIQHIHCRGWAQPFFSQLQYCSPDKTCGFWYGGREHKNEWTTKCKAQLQLRKYINGHRKSLKQVIVGGFLMGRKFQSTTPWLTCQSLAASVRPRVKLCINIGSFSGFASPNSLLWRFILTADQQTKLVQQN